MVLSRSLLFFAALTTFSGAASAQTLAGFDRFAHGNFNANPFFPTWIDDGVTGSALTFHGTVAKYNTNGTTANGWGAAYSELNYVGFTLEPSNGEMLHVTGLDFSTSRYNLTGSQQHLNSTEYRWGYRIDEGSGYGEWTFSGGYVNSSTTQLMTWDFDDFVTEGMVEFGLFAYAPTSTGNVMILNNLSTAPNTYDLVVKGAVSSVPEPGSALLGIFGGAFMLARRRHH